MDETRLLAEVTFNNVQVSSQQILGTIDHGWDVLQEGLLSFNAALCSSIVGSMEKSLKQPLNMRIFVNSLINRLEDSKQLNTD